MSLVPGTTLGVFEIRDSLGTGGMGEVYRARDTTLDRDVALKVLLPAVANDPDRLARFSREAHVLASLNHPNIAHIHGLEASGGVRALVMELVEGPTLADRIAQGAIPLDEALPIARQIAEALDAAHEQGVIHRDLKPANIKVRPDGTVKVLDFGLAKAMDSATSSVANPTMSPTLSMHATQAGIILGTAAYMSPEQARGAAVDRRADIWAFGVVLFEMLTGRRAFDGETLSDTLASVLKTEPQWTALPMDVPPAIRRLLGLCLKKDPKARLRDMGEARRQIEDVVGGPADTPLPIAKALSASRWQRMVPWVVTAAALMTASVFAWRSAYVAQPSPAVPLYLSIALPDVDASVRSLALSPDGRTVVMAASIGGTYQLWLRSLDSAELTPLPGTSMARVPFWSPDGRSVGFFADRKLKTISATGGPTRSLCDAEVGGGGTWARDGTILFAHGLAGERGIFRVAAAGGDCTPVTKPAHGTAHTFPEFLPDGRHFFFVVTRGDETRRGVYMASLDEPNGERVLSDPSSVTYSPPLPGEPLGSLLFLREDRLMAQPFDATALHVVGDPVTVVSTASRSNSAPQMAASTSATGVLVFLANGERSQGRQLAWVDRAGKDLTAVDVPSLIAVSLAPDGGTVATVVQERDGVTPAIWLRNLDRGTNTRFATAPSGGPVWSPDGRRLIFGAIRPGNAFFDLYWKDVGSADEHLLSTSAERKQPSDWSRDGQYLAYTAVNSKTGADIWILPTASRGAAEEKPFAFARTPFMESHGQIAPDGRWMAYVSDESGKAEVFVRPFPQGDGKWQVSTAGGAEPLWRADGKELFYNEGLISRLRVMAVSFATGGTQPSVGAPQLLFQIRSVSGLPQDNRYPWAPSSDGQRFLLQRPASDVQPTLDVLVNWQKQLRRSGSN